MDGGGGADVLHKATDIGRQPATRHLAIRDKLHELVFTPGRINRRNLFQDQAFVINLCQHLTKAMNGIGLVAFHDNETGVDMHGVQQNLGTADDLGGAFAHEHVIAADVGFTFDAIQYQVLRRHRARLHEFLRRRKYGAAEAHDAAIEDMYEQVCRRDVVVVLMIPRRKGLILSIALDDDTRRFFAMATCDGPAFNGNYRAR